MEDNRLKLIKELSEKIHDSLEENFHGFMNYYVEKIIKLTDVSYDIKKLYNNGVSVDIKRIKSNLDKLPNEKYINAEEELIKKEESELFWKCYDFYNKNSPAFRIEAKRIMGKLYISKDKKCFCGGDKAFIGICKECSQNVHNASEVKV